MTHPTHKTRFSDSSLYDEKCELCGNTDRDDSLNRPCPKAEHQFDVEFWQLQHTETEGSWFFQSRSDALVEMRKHFDSCYGYPGEYKKIGNSGDWDVYKFPRGYHYQIRRIDTRYTPEGILALLKKVVEK